MTLHELCMLLMESKSETVPNLESKKMGSVISQRDSIFNRRMQFLKSLASNASHMTLYTILYYNTHFWSKLRAHVVEDVQH